MKFIIAVLLLTVGAFAQNTKYKVGDCITPTNRSYTWYGKYARITAIEDGYDFFVGKSFMYYMNFYNYDAKANKFVAVLIDSETTKVSSYHCQLH